MTRFISLFMVVMVVGFLAACGSSKTEQAADTATQAVEQAQKAADQMGEHAAQAEEVMAEAGEPMTVEIACANCVYHMEGVESCAPAVKIGGQTMLLTGVDLGEKTHDLCTGPKTAKVTGTIEDGKFVASAAEIE